jgi:hypothetical protein
MTAAFMEEFRACVRDKMCGYTNKKWMKPVYIRLKEKMRALYPGFDFNPSNCKSKYSNERRRYRTFQAAIQLSGTTYDDETGLVMMSDVNKEKMRADYSPCEWLWTPNKSLGHVPTYEECFETDVATGLNVRRVNEGHTDSEVPDEVGDEDLEDNLDEHDGEPEQPAFNNRTGRLISGSRTGHSSRSRTRATSSRPHTPGAQVIISSDEDDGTQLIRPPKKKVLSNAEGSAYLGLSIQRAAAIVTRTRRPGDADVERAIRDVQKRFSDKLSEEEMYRVMEQLGSEGRGVSLSVRWNATCTDSLKERFIADLLKN